MILSSLCHYWKLSVCRVPWTLPSALDQTGTRQTDCVPSAANKTLGKHMTLGKASLCRVLFPRHSAKPPFAECHKPSTRQIIACSLDTRQSMTLCWVPLLLHSCRLCRVPAVMALGKAASPSVGRFCYFFFYRELSQQIKNTQQTRLCWVFGCLVTYAVGGTRKAFAECI